MISLDLEWLRKEIISQIENCVDDSVFIHQKAWEILSYDTIYGHDGVKKVAKKRGITLVVGTAPDL